MSGKNLFLASAWCLAFFLGIEAKTVTTSVVIPCYYKHAQHLYSLLEHYQNQTVLPDEVVVVISECSKVDPVILNALQEKKWLFPAKFIMSKEVHYAGENRNIGCSHAAGNVFILQDADDVPHPQRVEIIKYFFENYPVAHLMHGYFKVNGNDAVIDFPEYPDLSAVLFGWRSCFKKAYQKNSASNFPYTNGNVAIAKRVFKTMQWSLQRRGQDTDFNRRVYKAFKNCLGVKAMLLCYRQYLSSKTSNIF